MSIHRMQFADAVILGEHTQRHIMGNFRQVKDAPMRRRTVDPWEKGFQSIIEIYAGVADDLYLLDPSAGSAPCPDPDATLKRINDGFNGGQTIYNRWKGETPRKPDLEVHRFSAYRVSTSVTFGLLHLYCEIIPYVTGHASNVTVRARELAALNREEYVPWFLVMPEIAVMDKSNCLDMSLMIRQMSQRSTGRLIEFREHLRALLTP